MLPGQSPEGKPILSVLVKRSYRIVPGKKCVRAEHDAKLHPADVFHADPANSSVRYESDFVPFKLATDIVLNGTAYAPNDVDIEQIYVELQVHGTRKRVTVIGDRVCHFRANATPQFSDPQTFTRMELRYERAYGGVDIFSNPLVPFPYMRNPLGRGFAVTNMRDAIQGLPLPNLEDDADLLTPERLCCEEFTAWEKQPMPAGLSWLPRSWLPRSTLAGVLPGDRAVEQELRKAYAQLVPAEHRKAYSQIHLPTMDFRFFSGASLGLSLPFLNGDEGVRLTNLTPDSDCVFRLPGDTVTIGIDIGKGVMVPKVYLQTVMIRADDHELDLVWRAAAPYPGTDWFTKMTRMEVSIA